MSITFQDLQAAIAGAVVTERARCAAIADAWLASDYDESANVMAQNIGDDIRAGRCGDSRCGSITQGDPA